MPRRLQKASPRLLKLPAILVNMIFDSTDGDTMEHTQTGMQELYLKAPTLLRYLLGKDDQLDTLIMCNPANQRFFTTDQDLYNALGSMKDYDNFELRRLVKLLELVTIRPARDRTILKEEWVEKVRFEALKGTTK